ncbi:MAG: acyl carrier protein [Polyangiales bacterium]
MNQSDIELRVRGQIAKNLVVDVGDLRPEASFINDLGADSLAIVELVLALEEEFELDIPDEDTERIRTVQDAVDYITSRLANR